jgi:hypothetical protein
LFQELEFCVGVRADFAVQVDLFVLRGNPFHERGSFKELNNRSKLTMRVRKVEEGESGIGEDREGERGSLKKAPAGGNWRLPGRRNAPPVIVLPGT